MGGFVNVMDAADFVTDVDVVKIGEFVVAICLVDNFKILEITVATCSVDGIGGVPKIVALV